MRADLRLFRSVSALSRLNTHRLASLISSKDNRQLKMIIQCVPVHFLQGFSIRRWDDETCRRKGFDLPTAGLKLPVSTIGVGLED